MGPAKLSKGTVSRPAKEDAVTTWLAISFFPALIQSAAARGPSRTRHPCLRGRYKQHLVLHWAPGSSWFLVAGTACDVNSLGIEKR